MDTHRRDVEDDRQLRSTGHYHNVALNEQFSARLLTRHRRKPSECKVATDSGGNSSKHSRDIVLCVALIENGKRRKKEERTQAPWEKISNVRCIELNLPEHCRRHKAKKGFSAKLPPIMFAVGCLTTTEAASSSLLHSRQTRLFRKRQLNVVRIMRE